jgi:hypothetical protein
VVSSTAESGGSLAKGLLYSHSVVWPSSLSVVSTTAESGGSLAKGQL